MAIQRSIESKSMLCSHSAIVSKVQEESAHQAEAQKKVIPTEKQKDAKQGRAETEKQVTAEEKSKAS